MGEDTADDGEGSVVTVSWEDTPPIPTAGHWHIYHQFPQSSSAVLVSAHLFSQYLLSTSHVPHAIPGHWECSVEQGRQDPRHHGACVLVEGNRQITNKQKIGHDKFEGQMQQRDVKGVSGSSRCVGWLGK